MKATFEINPFLSYQELMGEFGVQTLCPVSNCGHTSDSGTTWIEHIGQLTTLTFKHIHTFLQTYLQNFPSKLSFKTCIQIYLQNRP